MFHLFQQDMKQISLASIEFSQAIISCSIWNGVKSSVNDLGCQQLEKVYNTQSKVEIVSESEGKEVAKNSIMSTLSLTL